MKRWILWVSLVTVMTLWLETAFVMEGQLSVGQLIAFQYALAWSRLAKPIFDGSVMDNFQPTGVSVQTSWRYSPTVN